jgi:hypothetical protein
MNRHPDDTLQRRLSLLAGAILILGLGSSLLLYLTAVETPESSMVSEFENSKVYRRSLEVYGGKLSVVFDELSRWFAGLWQGESLAITVAVLSVVSAGAVFFVAGRLPYSPHDDEERSGH